MATDVPQRLAMSVQLARPTLDDVFLTLTGRSLRDDSPVQPGRDREPELASTAG